ncbi:SH3 domain-containing protein [Mesorhizobium sp. CAU 1741]|uniref:SH3 domain-containing protein n=1 Tax=Mesorhizobium sp. CAU 1741 TaxID=3140366 RepID=UPI00325B570C
MKQNKDQPFLSPLGTERGFRARWRRIHESLPDSAAPIAFMLVGGVAVIALLGTLLSGDPGQSAQIDAAQQQERAQTTPAETATADAPEEAVASARSRPEPEPQPSRVSEEQQPQADLEPVEAPSDEPDPERTASILSAARDANAFVPDVEIAESEEEIAALEAIQREEVEEDVGPPSSEQTAAIPAQQTRAAITTNYVNMRAQAKDDAEVLEVVPALAEIEAQDDCDWCAVTYEGRSGYIYKTFISYR